MRGAELAVQSQRLEHYKSSKVVNSFVQLFPRRLICISLSDKIFLLNFFRFVPFHLWLKVGKVVISTRNDVIFPQCS